MQGYHFTVHLSLSLSHSNGHLSHLSSWLHKSFLVSVELSSFYCPREWIRSSIPPEYHLFISISDLRIIEFYHCRKWISILSRIHSYTIVHWWNYQWSKKSKLEFTEEFIGVIPQIVLISFRHIDIQWRIHSDFEAEIQRENGEVWRPLEDRSPIASNNESAREKESLNAFPPNAIRSHGRIGT